MRKFLSIVLVFCLFLVSFCFNGCETQTNCTFCNNGTLINKRNYISSDSQNNFFIKEVTNTATCESEGAALLECRYCGRLSTVDTDKTNHIFYRNGCKICSFEVSDISQLPLSHRKELAKSFLYAASSLSDIETQSYACELYRKTLRDYESSQKKVAELEETLEAVKNQKTVVVYQEYSGKWILVADEKNVKNAEKNLLNAQIDNAKNEELLLTLELSIEVNTMGAAWNVVINELESKETSNKKISSKLLAVFLGYDLSVAKDQSQWRNEFFKFYEEVTGIKMDLSQAISKE